MADREAIQKGFLSFCRRRSAKIPFTFCVDISLSAKPFVNLTELQAHKKSKVSFNLAPIGQYVLFSSTNWNLLLRQTESFKRYRLPTNISASIVKVFSFLKSISVLSTWKSSGVMSAKILISSNGISYDSETLFW